MSAPASIANQEQRIRNLEKRVAQLEGELSRLLEQEARASKYLKCVQKVEGNALTVPFKILNCIRK
jgi:TolA-binding protein